MSMMPIGMVVYGMLYDTLPATIILPVTSVIIIIISLVMLRSSILKRHIQSIMKALSQKVLRTQQLKITRLGQNSIILKTIKMDISFSL